MPDQTDSYKAVHLGDGNFFDNLRIDIERSHRAIDHLTVNKVQVRGAVLGNLFSYGLNALLQKLRLQEFLAVSGLRRAWFDDFHGYWAEVLGGRPLTVLDYFMLLHDYRKRQQHTKELSWDSPDRHVANWQDPSELYSTFAFTRNTVLRPIVGRALWRHLKKGSAVLEYGCSLAPYYNCYRNYFSHLNCTWKLADIANFPFHYAKYRYRRDEAVSFHTISADSFKDPLGNADTYDAIVVTTVLEHLDDPVFVSDYLLSRLKQNGLFIFDYVISEGKGLDTPLALKMRSQCLDLILSRIDVIHGTVDPANNVGLVIGRRR
jgi:SAM-dependent methyltransferase